MATPFELDRGTLQGRTDQGYELGHLGRAVVNLALGDKHEISQSFTVDAGKTIVTAVVHLQAPDALPAGGQWEFAALLNGVAHYTRVFDRAGLVVTVEASARLRFAPTPSTITYRLRIV